MILKIQRDFDLELNIKLEFKPKKRLKQIIESHNTRSLIFQNSKTQDYLSDKEKWTEAKTRKSLIDKAIEKRGWSISDRKQVIEEYSIDWAVDKDGKPVNERFVDYLLFDNVGDPLAVVEAKKY